jgi:hypothetical membrane protein
MKKYKLFAIAGILAPIIYFCMIVILGALEPNYSHLTKMMSLLGGVQGIRGWLFNIGIATTGMLVALFAIGLHQSINDKKRSKVGPVLLILGGLGLILAGIFHCDLNCNNVVVEKDFIGLIHILTSFIAGTCLSIAPFFIFGRFGKSSNWKNYATYTLVTGIIANIPGIIFWVTLATTRLPEIEGLLQRLGIVFIFIWIEVIALKMHNLNRMASSPQ